MLKRVIYGLVLALALSAGARAADDSSPSSYSHVTNFTVDAPATTSGSATSAAVLSNFPIATAGYGKIFVYNTSAGAGNTWTYEESSDGFVTTFAVACTDVAGAVVASTTDTTATAAVGRVCPVIGSQFRVRVSTFGSGTVTEVAQPRTGTASIASPGALAGAPNLLLNGNMIWDQRNETNAVAGNGSYSVDAWKEAFILTSATLTGTAQEASAPANFPNAVKITVGTGAAMAAGDSYSFVQKIEGPRLANTGEGTATASPLSLSIWLKSSISSAVIDTTFRNEANTQRFINECTLNGTAWTLCQFVMPGSVTGSWPLTAGASSARLEIIAACGSTAQGTAGAWANSSATFCTANQTNVFGTSSATLEIGPVKLEASPAPTGFVMLDPTTELMSLKRYYQKTFPIGTKPAQNAGVAGSFCFISTVATIGDEGAYWSFNPPMVGAAPTVTSFNPSATNANLRDVTNSADQTIAINAASTKGTTGVVIGEATQTPSVGATVCVHLVSDSAF